MQDVFVRKPSGIEAFFIDLDACGCNMTFHLYLKVDKQPNVATMNSTMKKMLDTHRGMNMRFYRNAWYTTSYAPECQVYEVEGTDLQSYKPSRLDFRKHTVDLKILHTTLSDVWYLCFDFFHGVADGLSGVQFVYNFFDTLNDRSLPEVAFDVSECQLVNDTSKPEWNGERPAFTVLPKCEPGTWVTRENGEARTTVIRTHSSIRHAAARLSDVVGSYFGGKSAKMIIPVNVRRFAGSSDKAMFGNLFVPMFLDVKTCDSLKGIHKKIVNYVKRKPRLMRVARNIDLYAHLPVKLRQAIIGFFIPIVMSSKRFIYCALVSTLGEIDSERLRSDAFNTEDCMATFESFPFTAFSVITLQFKETASTCVSWHTKRVPDEVANSLIGDLAECLENEAAMAVA